MQASASTLRDLLAAIRETAVARGFAAAAQMAELRRRAAECAPAPPLRLARFDLIAEVKRRAPSAGRLAGDAAGAVDERVAAYAAAGAAAVSVLTEPSRFDGSLDDLAAAAEQLSCPTLRKDFLTHPAQLYEARAAGAGGGLLILRILDDRALDAMVDVAAETGLFLLVEGFDERDLERLPPLAERAAAAGVTLLAGVNTRDLRTFEVDRDRLVRLRPRIPDSIPAVAESGIETPDDARRAAELGYRAALVGSALMRAADPTALARALLEAGRAAVTGSDRTEASCASE